MKRFLARLIWGLPTLMLGILAVVFMAQLNPKLEYILFAKGPFGSTAYRIPEYERLIEAPDFMALGSSTCDRSVDHRPFEARGLTAFNLCSSGQTFFNSARLLDWSLDDAKRPDIVMLDIYPSVWSLKGIESARDLTINHNLVHQGAFQRMAWGTGDISTILKATYFGVKRRFMPHGEVCETIVPFTYIQGGLAYSLMPPVDLVECVPDTCVLNRTQRRAFERIRRTCEEEGIQLLLVNPPQLCEEVFEKPEVMEGLPWIEGNDWPLAKVDTLYYDDHHLRGVGAELYSEWLAGQVAALMN